MPNRFLPAHENLHVSTKDKSRQAAFVKLASFICEMLNVGYLYNYTCVVASKSDNNGGDEPLLLGNGVLKRDWRFVWTSEGSRSPSSLAASISLSTSPLKTGWI